jgi:hypothetical protein
MKKQLSVVMISLSLGIWLTAVFNFSGPPNTQIQQTSISVFSDLSVLPDLKFFELGNHPEVPGFKVDWSLTGKLNSELGNVASITEEGSLPSSFFKKAVSLFDVKITFMHFFYPW